MRLPATYVRDRSATQVAMTPMIDVVFLLLVFFLWTASFRIAEQVLPSTVSQASGSATVAAETPPPELDFPEVVIRIVWLDQRPGWLLNDRSLPDLAAVQQTLEQIFRINPTAPVIVHPDPDTPLGDVIEVYDLTRRVGFREVQFAARA